MKFPTTIDKIEFKGHLGFKKENEEKTCGSWVSVRPCNGEGVDKTFLGIYLGELPLSLNVDTKTEEKEEIMVIQEAMLNPVIYIPDLKRVVMGYESWWGILENPEDLKTITDADINNVWYVRAIKDLTIEEN